MVPVVEDTRRRHAGVESRIGMTEVFELGGALILGAVPFAYILARSVADVDLRTVRTGTVSATNVYEVAGTVPFAVACMCDLVKGVTTAAIMRRRQPILLAAAAGLVVVGHNWSPFLRGAGGRGVLPTVGVLLVVAPQGAALFLAGIAVGYLLRDTAPGCLAAQLLLIPVLRLSRGRNGALLATALVTPMVIKRLLGNGAPVPPRSGRVYLTRLVYDRDVR